MSDDPWAGRYPKPDEDTFDHLVCELPVGCDLYEVTLAVTFTDDVDWSVEVKSFDPSYELAGEPATLQAIEAALEAAPREQNRVQEVIWQRQRDRGEERAERRAEDRVDRMEAA